MAASETLALNMGPQHPSTHGVLRLVLELDGESVIKTVPHIGYLHTGMEKTMENEAYQQAITITDRMDYMAAMSNNHYYCLAVEKLLAFRHPRLPQFTRYMLPELNLNPRHLAWPLTTHHT